MMNRKHELGEIQRTLGTIAAWAGGIALVIGALRWLDRQGRQ
jgi:hypothetical protein